MVVGGTITSINVLSIVVEGRAVMGSMVWLEVFIIAIYSGLLDNYSRDKNRLIVEARYLLFET